MTSDLLSLQVGYSSNFWSCHDLVAAVASALQEHYPHIGIFGKKPRGRVRGHVESVEFSCIELGQYLQKIFNEGQLNLHTLQIKKALRFGDEERVDPAPINV